MLLKNLDNNKPARISRISSKDIRTYFRISKMKKSKLQTVTTNYQTSLWPLCMLGEMLFYHYHKLAGKDYSGECLGIWENGVNRWAVEVKEYEKIPYLMWKKFEKNPKWFWRMAKKIRDGGRRLTALSRKIYKSNLDGKSDNELYRLYDAYHREYLKSYLYFWLPNSLEGLNNVFTGKLEDFIQTKLLKLGKSHLIGKYLSVLTTPLKESLRQKEERKFLQIVSKIQKNKKKFFRLKKMRGQIRFYQKFPSSQKYQELNFHCKKYCFLPFGYEGQAWDLKYFIERARRLVLQNFDARGKLVRLEEEKQRLKVYQRKFTREIGLGCNRRFEELFILGRELMYLKDYRKDKLFESYFHMDRLIRGIAGRLDLTPVQVRHILPQEMKKALVNRQYSSDELNRRIKLTVLDYTGSGVKIYTGRQARKIIAQRVQKDKIPVRMNQLTGQAAYPGKVKGKVKLIFKTTDIAKMKKGNILVSLATNPDLIPAMKKAAAIVTDKGGITSHAAIISRELKIPCVTGTKIATQILKDNETVEVDAMRGVVRKI